MGDFQCQFPWRSMVAQASASVRGASPFRRLIDFQSQFAEVSPPEQFEQCFGKFLEPLDNILPCLEFSGGVPARQFGYGLAVSIGVIEDNEAFHPGVIDEQEHV